MRGAAVLLASLVLVACGGEESTSTAPPALSVLEGTVTYRERMALRLDAVITVRLQDVSRADAPAVRLAEQVIPARGQSVPIPFRLEYDPARIDERGSYVVRAEIRGGQGELLFTTDTAHPVLSRDAPKNGVEVLVVRVAN